uniref:Uncharacterized protein n=1 Tax=uncultured prokaryote TaxID=198431 RepID=A0A0H5Q7G8_9ZZZZ|nr:hypothetical protein [uncultured prokaryote]
MAFAQHARLSMLGTWSDSPSEVWDFGCSVVASDGSPIVDCQAYVDDIGADLVTFFISSAAGMSNKALLQMVKVAPIGTDGRYEGDPGIYDAAAGSYGDTAQTGPGFCSFVWTYQSDRMRPPGKFGRSYPPNCTSSLTGSFTTAPLNATATAEAGAAFLTILQGSAGDAQPVIASNVTGMNYVITSVNSDTVVDVQRRRKNKIVGSRHDGSYTP